MQHSQLFTPQFEQDSMILDSIPKLPPGAPDPNVYRVTKRFTVPTLYGYDLTAFGFRHELTKAALLQYDPIWQFDTLTVDAAAHLWGKQAGPTGFGATLTGGNRPQLTWTNRHPGRSLDSTEVFRSVNGGTWTYRTRVGGAATSWTDTALANGSYSFFIRHATARTFPTFVEDTLVRPNSPTTGDLTVIIGPPPPPRPPAPSDLQCWGNFTATMDCSWTHNAPGAETQIYRDGVLKATRAANVATWIDSTVTRGVTYGYYAVHVSSGVSSAPSALVAAVAHPRPPDNLSCGGVGSRKVACAWFDTEPGDTVEVWRQNGMNDWSHIEDVTDSSMFYLNTGLINGVTYYYKLRYRRGLRYGVPDVSAYSNVDDGTAGQNEPYGPQP